MNSWRDWLQSVCWFLAASVATILCCTWIDPYLTITSPLFAQEVNSVIPFLLFAIVWGMSGRLFFSMAVSLTFFTAFVAADHVKWRYLQTNLVYADFKILSSLMLDPGLILGFVRVKLWQSILATVAIPGLFIWMYRIKLGGCRIWLLRLSVSICALCALVSALEGSSPQVNLDTGWEVYVQPYGAQITGVMGNILLGSRTADDVKTPVSAKAVEDFSRSSEVEAQASTLRMQSDKAFLPDIVVVQSESLFEPSQLCGLPDSPVLDNIDGPKQSTAGELEVPVFGGRTLQTEFEVLSGAPIKFFGGSMFAYYELVDHSINGWPRQLAKLGYSTIVMHPGSRGFWRRERAMPLLGFDTFVDADAFSQSEIGTHGFVTDDVFMRAVIAELDSSSAPHFVFAVTIANHGPWGNGKPDHSEVFSLIPEKLRDPGRAQLADYLSRSIDADRGWAQLKDALAQRKRPTIAVIYGDHLPGLAPVYEKLCFKDGKPPTDHMPPLQMWANFPIPPTPKQIPSYLLGGWVSKVAHLVGDSALNSREVAATISTDDKITPARRDELLGDYAHVAAQNLYSKATDTYKSTLRVVDASDSQNYFSNFMSDTTEASLLVATEDGFVVVDATQKSSVIDIPLKRRVASMTTRFRVSLGTNNTQNAAAHFVLSGDGRLLLDTYVSPSSTDVATIDVSTINDLHIQTTMEGAGAQALLKVIQMQCHDIDCESKESTTTDLLQKPTISNDRGVNLDYLLSKELSHKDGLIPIKRIDDDGLFIHSAESSTAWVEFDAADIETISFDPKIQPMDATCMKIPNAGKIELTISGDDEPFKKLFVSPGYSGRVRIDLRDVRRLRLSVDKAGDSRCDWFYVQIPSLTIAKHSHSPWWKFGL